MKKTLILALLLNLPLLANATGNGIRGSEGNPSCLDCTGGSRYSAKPVLSEPADSDNNTMKTVIGK